MAFLLIIGTQVFFMVPSMVVAKIDKGELRENLSDINVNLQENLFDGVVEGKYDKGGTSLPDIGSLPQENSLATAAFYTRYGLSGNTKTEEWGENTFAEINSLKTSSKITREEEEGIFYTIDQAMALEFLSIAYSQSQNQEITNLLETVYSSLNDFEANETVGYNGFQNAFWRAIDSKGNKYRPNDAGYKFCYTNISLWVISGMLTFGQEVKGTVVDSEEDYSGTSITKAKKIIEFVEDYCFLNGTGFLEYPFANMTLTNKNYYFNTQALAVLAYTRLYETTEEQAYLDKANMLVEYIIPAYYLDTGDKGGCVSSISLATGEKSDIKYGYDNALYIYALLKLYDATNEQTYLQRAEEIALFMNENLYTESDDGVLVGYNEYFVDGEVVSEDMRYWKTNALMMLVNEEIMWAERPWYVKYMWFLIIGAIVILAIIGIIILIRRRNRVFKKGAEFAEGILES
mgnify:FL=1